MPSGSSLVSSVTDHKIWMHQLAMHHGTGRPLTILAEFIEQERLHKGIVFHVDQYGWGANKIKCTACTCCIAKCRFADTRQNLQVAKADTETERSVEATKIVDFQSQQLRKLTQNSMRNHLVTTCKKAPGVNAL
jgi:hypothetical protein